MLFKKDTLGIKLSKSIKKSLIDTQMKRTLLSDINELINENNDDEDTLRSYLSDLEVNTHDLTNSDILQVKQVEHLLDTITRK